LGVPVAKTGKNKIPYNPVKGINNNMIKRQISKFVIANSVITFLDENPAIVSVFSHSLPGL